MKSLTKKVMSFVAAAMIAVCAGQAIASAQTQEDRPRRASEKISEKDSKTSSAAAALEQADPAEEAAIQSQISSVYEGFYNSYRLGPGDVLGIYVEKHPQDSVDRTVVSPVGQVYYPLLGNVTVVGKTVPQIQAHLTAAVSEFIKDPRVTIALLEAHSAKIGVLGDVRHPGVKILTRPMRVLDIISEAGGISETGSGSNVSVLRQFEDGRVQMLKVDVKKILKGKANPEENIYLRAGDTIIVHGNTFKKLGKITSMLGVTNFISFLSRGGTQ